MPIYDYNNILANIIDEKSSKYMRDTYRIPNLCNREKVKKSHVEKIRKMYVNNWKNKDGAYIYKIGKDYWLFYLNRNKKGDILANASIDDGNILVDISFDNIFKKNHRYSWALKKIKSPIEVNKVIIRIADGLTVKKEIIDIE